MKKFIKKLLVILILIISYMVINIIFENENFSAFALNQTVSTDINSIDSNQYLQIKEMLQTLKNQHPNWNFKILYTDIEWNEAIANEYVGHKSSPRNLVTANNSKYDGEWICKVCGETKYDNGNMHCASEAAIAYMMDPRNSINYSDVFQFMQLSYAECNTQTVKAMVAGTFLNNDSYINTIIDSAKKYNLNPYYIVARILQEQGKSGSTLSSGNGYNGQYIGYYNVFNIGASGNGKDNVILNGLKSAQSHGWNTMEKSIAGGTEIVAKDYIAKGQNTMYFQKFDVENSDGKLYWHQYMQNILAAQSEGQTLRKTFESVGSVDAGYTFIIPVYKNMPTTAATRPSTSSSNIPTTTDLVRVNVTNSLYLRDKPGTSGEKIASVYKDEIITRLNKATEKIDGTYWDYVMKADGTKGYAARETKEGEAGYKLYLVPVGQENPSEPDKSNDATKNDKVKIDNSKNTITAVPSATVSDLKSLMGETITVNNVDGQVIDGNLVTGYKVNDTYIISVLGDVNCDGEVTPSDYMRVKNHIMNKSKVEGAALTSADVNKDGNITPSDYMNIKNYIMNKNKIEL